MGGYCAIFSLSETGLQNSINSTATFFQSLGLPVNTKKTKVIVFNKRGLGPKNFPNLNFFINGCSLELCDKYTYLGLIFKPSGSFIAAQSELYTKASKAWFSISHIIYQNKKMPIDQSFQLLDSLVMPVGLYTAELLTLCAMPDSVFKDRSSVLKFWENFPLERINQRAVRTLLSVHKKASRLACLGELGRYPIFLKGLLLSIKYNWHLKYKADKSSLVYSAYQEMKSQHDGTLDSWLSRVDFVQSLFGIELHGEMSSDRVTNILKKTLQSKFEIFWKDAINDPKMGTDNVSHNKMRFYNQLKSCFAREPYIDNVPNRNQRSWLQRLRTSAHSLAIERGRYTNVPLAARYCVYCVPPGGGDGEEHGEGDSHGQREIDSEVHFIARCPRFKHKRACFLKRLECLVPTIGTMSELNLVKTILCPATPQTAKLADKFIGIMFKIRADIDSGAIVTEYPTWEPNTTNPFATFADDDEDESHHLDETQLNASFSSDEDSLLT